MNKCHIFRKTIFGVLFSVCGLVGGADAAESISIIPKPNELKVIAGESFSLNKATIISYKGEVAKRAAKMVGMYLRPATGFGFSVKTGAGNNSILLMTEGADVDLGDEGYTLSVSSTGVEIKALKYGGLFNGIQTLRQLLPVSIYSKSEVKTNWTVPGVEIKDKPRYSWRGMHLDPCRHFMSKEFTMKFIDVISSQKMNIFHWHLTEDQGWRIEIKKYPKLTEVGAWRDGIGFGFKPEESTHYHEDGRYGGFYTQEDIKEVVKYALDRNVTIVPEIELPGHSMAAIAAYPELSCLGKQIKIPTSGTISHDVYCPGNENTFVFLENVISEVADLFPGKYFHIGGDECKKSHWEKCPKCQKRIKDNDLENVHELQSYTIKRIEKFLNSKGKRMVGWDEILEGGLAPNATVMSWRGMRGGIKAARTGHDAIMTPNSHCYFDYPQDGETTPKSRRRFGVTMENVYSFEPTSNQLKGDNRKHILGSQGNLWTERMPNEARVEYMAFPRACALAEVVWTSKELKDFDDFTKRMTPQFERLRYMNVNARFAPKVIIEEMPAGFAKITTLKSGMTIRYTLDGSNPDKESLIYKDPIKMEKSALVRARAFHPSGISSFIVSKFLLFPEYKLESSLKDRRDCKLENVLDGVDTSIFWGGRPKQGDHITITFERALEPHTVEVLTGFSYMGDSLRQGVIEVSYDGEVFEEVAGFEKGVATAIISKPFMAVRIKSTADQKSCLIVREIIFK